MLAALAGKAAAQRSAGARKQAFQRFDADAHQGRSLDVRQFLVVLQYQGLALACRQRGERSGNALAARGFVELIFRQRRLVDGFGGVVIGDHILTAPQTVIAQVERHAMQPGVKACLAALPARRLFPDPHECFLRHVARLVTVSQHPGREREQPRQLARDHLANRSGFPAIDTREQLRVRVFFVQCV